MNANGLQQIKISEGGQEKVIEDPDEMERLIIQHNLKHFSQAEETPFATQVMKELIGRTATNKNAKLIL